jgi:hypothetical protein
LGWARSGVSSNVNHKDARSRPAPGRFIKTARLGRRTLVSTARRPAGPTSIAKRRAPTRFKRYGGGPLAIGGGPQGRRDRAARRRPAHFAQLSSTHSSLISRIASSVPAHVLVSYHGTP